LLSQEVSAGVNAETRNMPKFRQSDKPIDALPVRLLRYAEHLAVGDGNKTDAMQRAGLLANAASHRYIGPSRERSQYPALWDYYQQLRNRRLRLFDITAEAITDELKIIAFSRITEFIAIPTRNDLKRRELFDAKVRKQMGYTSDPEDEAILADEKRLLADFVSDKDDRTLSYAPGQQLKLKALEDIPEELIPAIQSIRETKDGLSIKLYDKLDALDKLARIAKLYDAEDDANKSVVIENLNVTVNGTKSNLLDKLNDI
jgi:hypothetical protein